MIAKQVKSFFAQILILCLSVVLWTCGPKNDPDPELPDYLIVPSMLEGYEGSGLITIEGEGLSLRAEGKERLDASTQTYRGVLGEINGEDVTANFTLGQPRPFRERSQVPGQYRSYGTLSILRTLEPGTYSMGIQGTPGSRGEIADLTLNLPGPLVYVTNSGTLTLTAVSLLRTQGEYSLYRLEGTFEATMYVDGVGVPAGQRNPSLIGRFDLLLVRI